MAPAKLSKRQGAILLSGLMNKKGQCKRVCKTVLNYFALFLIVCLYAVAGAYILIAIESGAEEERIIQMKIAADDLKSSRDYIVSYTWYHSSMRHDEREFIKLITGNLDLFHKFVVDSAINSYYDGNPNEWNYAWTFPKSLLFTVTTMGSIGYGHIVPKTSTGQIFTIYYGMIGVPLLLLFLAIIGNFLATSFRYIYSRMCCRWCRIRRVKSELKKKSLTPKILWKDEIGVEPYMPTSHANVPIVINLCMIFVYLMLGGVLFSYWEGWQMYEAIYFTFITLSTIGFGDYVPGNAFSTGDQTLASSMKMIVTIAFCLFGMALISMAINLMQEELIIKTKWLAQELGISSNGEDNRAKYVVKKHEPGTIQETPPDRDGNQSRVFSAADENRQNRRKSVIFI